MALYPDEHEVRLVHAAGTSEQRVEVLPLYEIDRSSSLGMLTSMYLPPLAENASFEALQEIVAHLRAPDGCPWDREQNHQSLRPYLLEETYEVLEALDNNDSRALQEELGDLLLQVVLHAQIANEMGEFNMSDVLVGVHEKLIRRHPHVFAGWDVKDSKEVLRNWQHLKEIEKEEEGKSGEGLLDGVAATLPALLQAEQYQKRVARVGFDWRDIQGVFDKVVEEIEELRSASNLAQREKEIGDLLFSVVNLARWLGVEAESALRTANARFRKRFSFIEAHARAQGRNLRDFSLDEMDALWNQAKMDSDG
jgi:tetrapyrrole methylase family protein/MazG family protein